MRKRALVVMAVALAACGGEPEPGPCGGEGVICHVAGTGEAGFNGDGQPADATLLYLPTALRPGPDGLLYVMDFNNFRLRCVRGDRHIDTVVGSGVHSIAEDGSPALASPLENPIDFAFDAEGRVVFVSLHDPRVLRVERGTVRVLAGTGEVGNEGDGADALEASFNELASLAIAPDGTVFVSDDLENRVRAIRPDGTVVAYAGSGEEGYSGDGGPAIEARLDHPEGLAVDAGGNLYIADTYNHAIRRVDAKSGIIETIAGTGEGGLSGDGGPAELAQLRWPSGVSVAPDGTVYIADTFNHRIRRVRDGVIDTVAGTTEGRSGDGGPALAAQLRGPGYLQATADALYIADTQNHLARVLHLR